ncbi:zinc-dependent alcohol dehydrogenase [Sporolactobacillus nakayamae]|uniref:(R,R)-butanediol dehydrogenase / meso-butanediol dehydrogenase / diacetyl reductase n=1 Tax=Sporolactobacillus nakayamae TaxID=269670 RepID=A0A1I2TZX1_9BACL|nr:alcohol dehydrogenase catalytic domain-containing protein [Sporolactobacillus nakayamae]SFG70253.1 (R,R)-butanediol dehydrogenase / meso-butanediol dehydrogenase / diacetyl reductase [Sporolactobacillus nakayamae]
MKVLRNYGIGDVRVEQAELPITQNGEVLIKVHYAGICGSDLHIYRKGMFVQCLKETMGHECVGEVVSMDAGASLKAGDYVVCDPRVPCLNCSACKENAWNRCAHIGFIGEVRPGCFAEYMAVPVEKLIPVKEIRHLEWLTLTEPLAVALHLCRRAAVLFNDKVLIFGAGPIGLMAFLLLKYVFHINQITVMDLSDQRLSLAQALGANTIRTLKSSDQSSFDLVLETTGAPVCMGQAVGVAKSGGRISVVALYESKVAIDANQITEKELSVHGSSTYTTDELREAAQLIESGHLPLDKLITRIAPIEEAPILFEQLAKEAQDCKVLFQL